MSKLIGQPAVRYLIPGVFLTGLLLLSYQVLSEFIITIIGSLILAYICWPPYRGLRKRLQNQASLSAAIMALLITCFICMTIFWLASLLQDEVKMAYQALVNNYSQNNFKLPSAIHRLPWLAEYLQGWVDQVNHDRAQLMTQIVEWIKQWLGQFTQFLGGIGNYLLKLGLVPIIVFFCFRDGDEAVKQMHRGLIHFLGKYQNFYLQAVADTTRAVVYGQVLAAIGQGVAAGIGYAVAGVQAPALFGAITALLGLVPMGAMLVWVSISVALLLIGELFWGVGLLIWGFLVISTIDNFIRPIVISGTSQVPFLLVMFGVIGGLKAYGPIGLFLGPIILSVLLSVWQAWLKLQNEDVEQMLAEQKLEDVSKPS
ncbi:MAG: AI-2E family transporter [Methylococcaceae bacterium]|jgi:Ca2+-transporting ATPase